MSEMTAQRKGFSPTAEKGNRHPLYLPEGLAVLCSVGWCLFKETHNPYFRNLVCYNGPMLRILLLHSIDWLNPHAGPCERYLHEVFKRIAAQGHYVVWVASRPRVASGEKSSAVRIIDGIQLAHIGQPLLYRHLTGMLLPRLRHSSGLLSNFDVVVEGVTGKPLQLHDKIDWPIVPLVFRLSRKIRPSEEPPGPILVTTDQMWRELAERGMPEAFIVRAPFGVASKEIVPAVAPGVPPHGVALMARRQEKLLHLALREAEKTVPLPPVRCIGGRNLWPRRVFRENVPLELYRQAHFACLFEGAEREALAFAAAGVPVVCPGTAAGKEYVVDGETGLLYPPGDFRALGERLATLWRDEPARVRLGRQARAFAESCDWDRTAGLVLATLENIAR
jgi:glycosyltransferase involved in cell wall biosynthesis